MFFPPSPISIPLPLFSGHYSSSSFSSSSSSSSVVVGCRASVGCELARGEGGVEEKRVRKRGLINPPPVEKRKGCQIWPHAIFVYPSCHIDDHLTPTLVLHTNWQKKWDDQIKSQKAKNLLATLALLRHRRRRSPPFDLIFLSPFALLLLLLLLLFRVEYGVINFPPLFLPPPPAARSHHHLFSKAKSLSFFLLITTHLSLLFLFQC